MTVPDTLTPFSPDWYAWHAAHPRVSRSERVAAAVFNAVVGVLMCTVGWRA
jgi:hypothetical protein